MFLTKNSVHKHIVFGVTVKLYFYSQLNLNRFGTGKKTD
ncbi:hypothetical protein LEP1GSC013_3439 [Leptospira interrogans serovar Valbuzzi str. Duyster]|nr:hypothetical protein LEP1GSC013_3439 [Leptospira interrogans serovar Valbuzzi str. Duyster]ENO70153.1 hypothetical protein LEP1GSC012_4121 [Leptospira interrogans serovar Valbuzzi str. Valbuzzi]